MQRTQILGINDFASSGMSSQPAVAKSLSSEPLYVKVANFPGLYRNTKSGRYYAVKKVHGRRKEHSLDTADRKIAERRFKAWVESLSKVDSEVEKTTLKELIKRFHAVTQGLVQNSQVTNRMLERMITLPH